MLREFFVVKMAQNLYINCDFILGSAAEVERLWSSADEILTKKRLGMHPETFENLLFLKYNMRLWYEDEKMVLRAIRRVQESEKQARQNQGGAPGQRRTRRESASGRNQPDIDVYKHMPQSDDQVVLKLVKIAYLIAYLIALLVVIAIAIGLIVQYCNCNQNEKSP